uniref:Uncharacterized protein n=1 Tax=Trypanosoma vivax (strain Y486) TaxID=1055687 RepID=G0U6P6_TRYVY|nr:hypothetical protein TVY486_1006010 [Trypanosoma vivax Y486]
MPVVLPLLSFNPFALLCFSVLFSLSLSLSPFFFFSFFAFLWLISSSLSFLACNFYAPLHCSSFLSPHVVFCIRILLFLLSHFHTNDDCSYWNAHLQHNTHVSF